ncbi:apolipoprotein N-acyltransferase [Mycobacterium sp.]|uniref:apolipoprotein N-acyltransferase n=1 Tax=Mycobacterium sp. TaxID=1785 RepID=UPI003450AB52
MADRPTVTDAAGANRAVGAEHSWHGARTLLAGPLRWLVGGQCLGQLADGLAQITFAQFVLFDIGRGATPARIAAVLAVTLLPFSVVGPIAGVLIDRWDRRRTLITVSVLRAALTVVGTATLVTRSTGAAFVGVLLLLSFSRFVLAAKGAALPRTVPLGDLVTGNAVSSLGGMTSSFLGAVGGSLIVGRSTAAGFVLAAGCYLGAAAVFTRLPDVGGRQRTGLLTRLRQLAAELAEGIRAAAGAATIRWSLLAVAAHRSLLGAGFVVLVLIADSRYNLRISGYGVALAATGLAAFAGTLAAPPLARRYAAVALVPAAFLPAAAAAYVGGLVPSLAMLVGCVSVVAFAFQVLKISVDALIGGAASDVVRGRVFAVYDVLYNVAFVVAGLALVPLWRPGRERWLLWLIATGFLIGWVMVGALMLGWKWRRRTRVRRRGLALGRLAALGAGALLAPAFPAPSWWWLAWVGVVPLLLLVRAAPTAGEGGVRAWCGLGGFVLTTQYWLLPSAGPLLVVMAALLGAFWIPWGWATHRLLSGRPTPARTLAAVIVVPSAWVLAEAVRSWQSLGGPWALLGASQWNQPVTMASAALGGVWLTSFLLMAVNTAIAAAVLCRGMPARVLALGAALACAALGPGYYLLRPVPLPGTTVRVALVQPGNIADAGARLAAGEAITANLAGQRLNLIVWGESSVGFDLSDDSVVMADLTRLSRRIGADLLVNVDAPAPSGGIYKSAVLIGPSGRLGSYRKIRLVPFGEYVPFRAVLGWVTRHTKAAAQDRSRGTGPVVLHAGRLTLGPLISYEATFSDLARREVALGAQLLVYQSSTSTFQGSWAQPQLASQAAVHAVEVGRPAVHAGLSGDSSAFDATGRELAWRPSTYRGAAVVTVPLGSMDTGYQRFGDWVPGMAFTVLAGAGVGATLRSQRRRW